MDVKRSLYRVDTWGTWHVICRSAVRNDIDISVAVKVNKSSSINSGDAGGFYIGALFVARWVTHVVGSGFEGALSGSATSYRAIRAVYAGDFTELNIDSLAMVVDMCY